MNALIRRTAQIKPNGEFHPWDAISDKNQFKPAIQGTILLYSSYLTIVKSTPMEWVRKNVKSTKYRKVKTHCASMRVRNWTYKWGRNSEDVKCREENLK